MEKERDGRYDKERSVWDVGRRGKEEDWGQIHLPSQVSPSPMNPFLHSHLKPPRVLIHCASTSQLSNSNVHSFSSENGNDKNITTTNTHWR